MIKNSIEERIENLTPEELKFVLSRLYEYININHNNLSATAEIPLENQLKLLQEIFESLNIDNGPTEAPIDEKCILTLIYKSFELYQSTIEEALEELDDDITLGSISSGDMTILIISIAIAIIQPNIEVKGKNFQLKIKLAQNTKVDKLLTILKKYIS